MMRGRVRRLALVSLIMMSATSQDTASLQPSVPRPPTSALGLASRSASLSADKTVAGADKAAAGADKAAAGADKAVGGGEAVASNVGSSVDSEDGCEMAIDAFFLQDTTGSFIEDIGNIKGQIPALISEIEQYYPGTHFGFGEFRDKPYLNLGELTDYCYKRHSSLTTDVDKLQNDFGKLWASGGGDLPEAQFHAIIDAVNDPFVGWRELRDDPEDMTKPGARLIVISTDATPHDPGDYDLWPGGPTYLPPFPLTTTGISSDRLCKWYDYPSHDRLKEQLEGSNTYLGILTPSLEDGVGENVVARWKQINEDILEQPSGFYQFIQADSTDFVEALVKVLRSVTAHACEVEAARTTPIPDTTEVTTELVTELTLEEHTTTAEAAPAPETVTPTLTTTTTVTTTPTTTPTVTTTPTPGGATVLVPTFPSTAPPATVMPATLPTTVAPATVMPATLPPATVMPSTLPPATAMPAPIAPATVMPATLPPATAMPAPIAPATVMPATLPPATAMPAPIAPATVMPATLPPATAMPAPIAPATVMPATLPPPAVMPATMPATEPATEVMTTMSVVPDPSQSQVAVPLPGAVPLPAEIEEGCCVEGVGECCDGAYGVVVKIADPDPKVLTVDYERK